MKKGRSSILLVLIILLFIAGIGYFLYSEGIIKLPSSSDEKINYEKNDLFFVTKNKEKFGINKSDGNTILEAKYDVLLRNGDTVYIKDENDSYIFFLKNNSSISLGGKETDVHLAYDKNTSMPLSYYILAYGNGGSAIYRIYTNEGVRYTNKDFTSLQSAYEFLDAKVLFATIKAPNIVTEKYKVESTLSYPTKQLRTQYIVTEKEEGQEKKEVLKYGIVDELGRIILDVECDEIQEMVGSEYGVVATRNERTYLFMQDEKLIEVDSGFEFITGNDYILQKKGSTANKVYNLNGEVVIDGIYDYSKELTTFKTLNYTYMFTKDDKVYNLYNIDSNKKYDTQYTNISVDYVKDYLAAETEVWATAFIFLSNNVPYCVDLNTMKESRMNVVTTIYSPLDIGYKYISVEK